MAWLSQFSACGSRRKWYRQNWCGIRKQATCDNTLLDAARLKIRATSGHLCHQFPQEQEAFRDCDVVVENCSSDSFSERAWLQESGPMGIGMKSSELRRGLWVMELYLRPQNWISMNDGLAHCLPSFWTLQSLYVKCRNHDKGKSKMIQCSQTLNWPLTSANEVETVSLRLSVAMASQKRVSSSAIEGLCGLPRKTNKNQGLCVRKR